MIFGYIWQTSNKWLFNIWLLLSLFASGMWRQTVRGRERERKKITRCKKIQILQFGELRQSSEEFVTQRSNLVIFQSSAFMINTRASIKQKANRCRLKHTGCAYKRQLHYRIIVWAKRMKILLFGIHCQQVRARDVQRAAQRLGGGQLQAAAIEDGRGAVASARCVSCIWNRLKIKIPSCWVESEWSTKPFVKTKVKRGDDLQYSWKDINKCTKKWRMCI